MGRAMAMILLFLGSTAASAVIAAEDVEPRRPTKAEFVAQFDSNGDGTVTYEELTGREPVARPTLRTAPPEEEKAGDDLEDED